MFCTTWIAAALWAAWQRGRDVAWGRMFVALAAVLASIAPINALTTQRGHLSQTLARGDWALAMVDLTALALAAAFALLAWRRMRRTHADPIHAAWREA